MRAVLREVPQRWLDERARLGLDRYDEQWEGVLHMGPAPGFVHQDVAGGLYAFLKPLLAERGIRVLYETEVHRPGAGGSDYRIPDMVFFRAEATELITARGLQGAPLGVLDIRSPDDETYEKFEFWARLGVPELIVIEPEARRVEIYRFAGGRYVAVPPDGQGWCHAASIDVRFSTAPGDKPRLRVQCGGVLRDI